jgi:hypothetical protein
MMNFCACAAIDELVIFHLLHPSSCGLLDAAKAKHELPPREKVGGGGFTKEAGTHVNIAHGDARHDCRYMTLYLRSGEGIGRTRRMVGVVELVVDASSS